MVRKMVGTTLVDPGAKTGLRSPFRVVQVGYEKAAAMLTVSPDSHLWQGGRDGLAAAGMFVRLKPPTGLESVVVEKLKQAFLKAGALAVRVIPAPSAAVLVDSAEAPQVAPHKTIREVVAKMVAEANTADREALATLVETAIAKAGL